MSKSKVNLWETHTSTVLSITLVMFLLGLCLMVEYHIYRATHDMQERITFKVDLTADITDEDAAQLKQTIEAIPYVKHVDYISRQQAAEIFSEDLDDDFVGFIGYNPLYPSMMVNLRADYMPEARAEARAESIARFSDDVSSLENVIGVAYQENIVNELNDVFYKATWFLIVFMALLVLISILMIRSTISIALYAQRETIRTMQLVGAKSGFIAHPFLTRSIWYGLLGALIAILVLAIATGIFNQSLGGLDLLAPTHMLWYAGIAGIIIILGIVLSYFSTLSAVMRYLHNNR
ncbi:MAG: permease-like cell division protein FtsX [Bacteroidales bacterium]|nr:permease-like cell division protein FtsX [Bacteroidales bacterium]